MQVNKGIFQLPVKVIARALHNSEEPLTTTNTQKEPKSNTWIIWGFSESNRFPETPNEAMETCFEDIERKANKPPVLSHSTTRAKGLNPAIIHTCNEELFGESTAVKGGDFLLQDHNKYPENTEKEHGL